MKKAEIARIRATNDKMILQYIRVLALASESDPPVEVHKGDLHALSELRKAGFIEAILSPESCRPSSGFILSITPQGREKLLSLIRGQEEASPSGTAWRWSLAAFAFIVALSQVSMAVFDAWRFFTCR